MFLVILPVIYPFDHLECFIDQFYVDRLFGEFHFLPGGTNIHYAYFARDFSSFIQPYFFYFPLPLLLPLLNLPYGSCSCQRTTQLTLSNNSDCSFKRSYCSATKTIHLISARRSMEF